jgi:hypothetical protein
MTRVLTMMLTAVGLSLLCSGCVGRLFSEGMGAAGGASGRVVGDGRTPDLTKYKSLRVESITVAHSSQAPAELPGMLRADFAAVSAERGLKTEGAAGLKLSGEVVHYETSSTTGKALGPLGEVIVHAILTDAESGAVLAETNLVGRSKASSSSSTKNVSEGAAKALDEWLKEGGLKKVDEKNGDRAGRGGAAVAAPSRGGDPGLKIRWNERERT